MIKKTKNTIYYIFIVIFLISQNIYAKQIETSDEKLLAYKVQELKKNVDFLKNENQALQIEINTLKTQLNSNINNIENHTHLYDKVLESTNNSYNFLREILYYFIGAILFIFAMFYYLSQTKLPEWLKKKIEQTLKEMSKDGFASKIDEWIKNKNKNLMEDLKKLENKYDIQNFHYNLDNEFKNIVNKEYFFHKDSTQSYPIEKYKKLVIDCFDETSFSTVKDILTNALPDYSSDSKIFTLLAIISLYEEEFEKAITNLDAARRIEPNNFYIYHLLGYCYLKNEDYSKAQNNFEKAIEYNSNILNDYLYIGTIYLKNNDILKLEILYNKAILLCPLNDIRIYLALGSIYSKLGNFSRVKEMLEKIQYFDKNEI